ncbi:uncharacterized protein [Musca autumnalis]|uniref:uncharacterized protein n=1 Tax=Musca autumnalis TaxID=221902 RepID=UPI003CF89BC7
MKQTQRKRSRNFTMEEELLLVNLVGEQKHCIENKKSDAVVWKQKEEAWRKVEDGFAATTGLRRSFKALRDKYDHMKRRAKREMVEQNLEGADFKMSTVSQSVLSMLGDLATDLDNTYDDGDIVIKPEPIVYFDEDGCNEFHEESNSEYSHALSASIERNNSSIWRPNNSLHEPTSKEGVIDCKRKRNLEEEKIELVLLQQEFYKNENVRAQEKHEQEIISLKLKNEILQLELEEKKLKIKELKDLK